MKGHINYVSGYSYVDTKTGLLKQGMSFFATTIDKVSQNDGQGNFKLGSPSEEFKLYPPFIVSPEELMKLCNHDVEIVREKPIGERFEYVVSITPLDDDV